MFTVDPTDLPARQQVVYRFLIDYWFANGFPAVIRDVCEHLGSSSPNGATAHLNALVRKQLLRRRRIQRRGQVRVVYAPTDPQLRLEPCGRGGVRLGTVGGPVAFTGAAWVAWLREQLARSGG